MKKLSLTTLMALTLFFMASSPSHAASGTYIDCIHGCPNLIVCKNCCNETFSDVLSTCNANRDRCEALCPPGANDCLNNCTRDRNNCLGQGSRDFVCPQWGGGPAGGSGNSGFSFKQSSPFSFSQKSTRDPTCASCHEDDR